MSSPSKEVSHPLRHWGAHIRDLLSQFTHELVFVRNIPNHGNVRHLRRWVEGSWAAFELQRSFQILAVANVILHDAYSGGAALERLFISEYHSSTVGGEGS